MDFSNRNAQSNQPPAPAVHTAPASSAGRKRIDRGKGWRIAYMGMLFAIVILIVAVIVLIAVGPKSEDSYVDTTKLQAVFLNTGQVYFGNIKTLNDKYFVLTNIYYLQTANSGSSTSSSSTSSANTNVTLVKLGCELHEPYDKMVINHASVTFWENLQSSGQVAQAVATFQKQNPQGQKCSDQSASSSSTSNSVQSAGSSSTPSTTPSSSTTTKP
jgi:hypothetical protein